MSNFRVSRIPKSKQVFREDPGLDLVAHRPGELGRGGDPDFGVHPRVRGFRLSPGEPHRVEKYSARFQVRQLRPDFQTQARAAAGEVRASVQFRERSRPGPLRARPKG